jgi:hypothetical protein
MANAKDGSRCGRTARPGTMLCSKHDGTPNAGATAPKRGPLTPMETIEKLMQHSDPAIRLRAVNAYLDQQAKQEKGCPQCEARAEDDRLTKAFLAALTADERERLVGLLVAVRLFKEDIWARLPNLRPEWVTTPLVKAAPPPAAASGPAPKEQTPPPSTEADPDDELVEAQGVHGPRLVRRCDLNKAYAIASKEAR